MAMIIDPLTGKKTYTYTSGETITRSRDNDFWGQGGYSNRPVSSWDYSKEGQTLMGLTDVLSTFGNKDVGTLLGSAAGVKLREVNPEIDAYYEAYIREEQSRKQAQKVFGVQNTVLTGAGGTASAGKTAIGSASYI